MGRVNSSRKRTLKPTLFALQGGKCFWCHEQIYLHQRPKGTLKARRATLDHLDERDSPNRGRFPDQRRIVLACFDCNNDRSSKPLSDRLLMTDQALWSLARLVAA